MTHVPINSAVGFQQASWGNYTKLHIYFEGSIIFTGRFQSQLMHFEGLLVGCLDSLELGP